MSENFQLAVMLKEGHRRQEVLHAINKSKFPLSSKEVSKRIGMTPSNAIRILRELEEKGAVREVTGRRRDRRYEITKKGRKALLMKEKLGSRT